MGSPRRLLAAPGRIGRAATALPPARKKALLAAGAALLAPLAPSRAGGTIVGGLGRHRLPTGLELGFAAPARLGQLRFPALEILCQLADFVQITISQILGLTDVVGEIVQLDGRRA